MAPLNQPEATAVCLRSFYTFSSNLFLLVSFLILVYVYSLFYCFGKNMLSFFKASTSASFYASLLMHFLAGSNHSVDHGYPSTA